MISVDLLIRVIALPIALAALLLSIKGILMMRRIVKLKGEIGKEE